MSAPANAVSNDQVKTLFSPIRIGPLTLSHRVVMAPLTRLRSKTPGDIPIDLMVEYYEQRASAGGLIVSEGATVSIGGRGYFGAPGIYSEEQITGWRSVTEAVHAKGGYILRNSGMSVVCRMSK
jgi:N-ethylmaleimide reductase